MSLVISKFKTILFYQTCQCIFNIFKLYHIWYYAYNIFNIYKLHHIYYYGYNIFNIYKLHYIWYYNYNIFNICKLHHVWYYNHKQPTWCYDCETSWPQQWQHTPVLNDQQYGQINTFCGLNIINGLFAKSRKTISH